MKTKLSSILLLLLLTSNIFVYGDCDTRNVFTLTAKFSHQQSSCTKRYDVTQPHSFGMYRAAIIHKNYLSFITDENRNHLVEFKSPDGVCLEPNKTSSVDIPLISENWSAVARSNCTDDIDIDNYYVLITITVVSISHSSGKPIVEEYNPPSTLRQHKISYIPIGGQCNIDPDELTIIKLVDLLNTTLVTSSGCEKLEFNLSTKCPFVIEESKVVYQGYPYSINLRASEQCGAQAIDYTNSMFRWWFTHGDTNAYVPLNRQGRSVRVMPSENRSMPVGKNIVVKVLGGRSDSVKNSKVVCFYPNVPQPTLTGFQRIPEGKERLQELQLKFNRSPLSNMQEELTLLTVYKSVAKKADGTPNLSQSLVLFQEAIDMKKFNGTTYTTSVINRPMSEGSYYVTVEGKVRGRSNNPDKSENAAFPAEVKTAMFRVIPFEVGRNDIQIEKTEFTPPVCHGGLGKVKLTINECIVPGVTKNPVFYYRKGVNPDGSFFYDTLHFRCTYSGTNSNPHAVFECDHIRSGQTHFKMVIPATIGLDKPIISPVTPVIPLSTMSLSTMSTNESQAVPIAPSLGSTEERLAYFSIDFTQPERMRVPVEVKHISGYYYTNRQVTIATDGEVRVYRDEASGGTRPYAFFFQDDYLNRSMTALTSNTIAAPYTGTRNIRMKDSKGCIFDTSVFVSNLGGFLFVKLDVERAISCYNLNDGILKATLEKSTGNPLSYAWYKDGVLISGSSNMRYNLGPGRYKVVVTDSKTGMASSDELTLTQPSQLALSVQQQTNVDCFGDRSGSLALAGSGGVTPYLYLWDNVNYGSLRRNLPAGEYRVKLIDKNSCELSKTYTISQPAAAFEIKIDSVIHAHYNAAGNRVLGRILLHTQGGTKPYGAISNSNVGNLNAGTYHFEQRDAKQCFDQKDVVVKSFDRMNIRIVQDQANRSTQDASAACHVEIAGGVPPFSVLWNNGKTTPAIDRLARGLYSVQVRDAAGVRKDAEIWISSPLQTDIFVQEKIRCHGEENGALRVEIQGGKPPYRYRWNGRPDTTAALKNLAAGTYKIFVTDALGVRDSASLTLTEPEALQIRIDSIKTPMYPGSRNGVALERKNDGFIGVSALGGNGENNFLWTNQNDSIVGRTPVLNELPDGDYRLLLQDKNACSARTEVHFPHIEPLMSEVNIEHPVSCFGFSDAVLQAHIQGGLAPYDIVWKANGEKMADSGLRLENKKSGFYELSVRDSLGVESVYEVLLSQPDSLQLHLNTQEVLCFGDSNGIAAALVQGGTAPYLYQWTVNGEELSLQDSLLSHIENAQIELLVSDTRGCRTRAAADMQAPPALELQVRMQEPSYHGSEWKVAAQEENDGRIDLVASGGTPPYRYRWHNGDTTDFLAGLDSGFFQAVLYDRNNCAVVKSGRLPRTTSLHTSLDLLQAIRCADSQTATFRLVVRGGRKPYAFAWFKDDKEIDEDSLVLRRNMGAGMYKVSVRDANGIASRDSLRITEPVRLQVQAQIREASAWNLPNGSIRVNVRGGTPPYQLQWNGTRGLSDSNALLRGAYRLRVQDSNHCTLTEDYFIDSPDSLFISSCVLQHRANGINGFIKLSIQGGLPPYHYRWKDAEGKTLSDSAGHHKIIGISNLVRGIYHFVLRDSGGAVLERIFEIQERDSLEAAILINNGIYCFGERTAKIEAWIHGGRAPYAISWSRLSDSGQTPLPAYNNLTRLENLPAGTYRLKVRDSEQDSCFAQVQITQPEKMQNLIESQEPSCHDMRDGFIRLRTTGGNGRYAYAWSNGKAGDYLSQLGKGVYVVRVSDARQCTLTDTIVLDEPKPLQCLLQIDSILCPEEKGRIAYQAVGGTAPYLYRWTRRRSKESDDLPLQGNEAAIDPAGEGLYRLYVEDDRRCNLDTTVFLPQAVALDYKLNREASLCLGQNIRLEVVLEDSLNQAQYLWISPDGAASDSSGIHTDVPGVHHLKLIQNKRCIYRDSVLVKSSSDSIHAEFWVSSQINTQQNCLLVNLSKHRPDSIVWHIPPQAFVLNREGNYLEIQFRQEGVYTLGMTTYKGLCSESVYRRIQVLDAYRPQNVVPNQGRTRWHLSPNPTRGTCRLVGESEQALSVRYRLFHVGTAQVVQQGSFEIAAGGQVSKNVLREHHVAGMYLLLLEYGSQKQSFKIVKL